MRFFHDLPVRYADTDAQARVFFANYLTYFDEGMTHYLHEIGLAPSVLLEQGIDFVYVDVQCRWQGSAQFGDRVYVQTAFTEFGNTSFQASFSIHLDPDSEPIATGKAVMVTIDPEGNKVRVPDALREAVGRYAAI